MPNAVISFCDAQRLRAFTQPKLNNHNSADVGIDYSRHINQCFFRRRASPATRQQPKSLFTHVAPYLPGNIPQLLFAQTPVGKIST
ncbi:hypothetical protein KCP76_17380 [Salmonella enterica subsp. enterica serovar Weltevreden]|nr:hypothetical protein KCP76_17380 [Salmonella enterica subsp. enterica serovar Weltevreden]